MNVLDNELVKLKKSIVEMSEIVNNQLNNATVFLFERDKKLAEDTIKNDLKVNQMEVGINENCIKLLALYQPEAADLMFITTSMKIITDLERMGDLCASVCQIGLKLTDGSSSSEEFKCIYSYFEDVARRGDEMLKMAIKMYSDGVKDNIGLKDIIIKDENVIDVLSHKIVVDIMNSSLKDLKALENNITYIFIARKYERFADHAQKIMELLLYMDLGKDLRNLPEF
ncbi:MAG: phosphate signaling complex protein PhoU [Deltaproteobacteria bacterium]|nr:phosphate signaling complex protein PhoU [Deltaproteobacteria bacterium]